MKWVISSFDKMLYAFIAFIAVLIFFRLFYFNSWHFVFLLWNIFLAWLPYTVSRFLKVQQPGWKQLLLCGIWLLFLPNAFYIVTDLVHLRHPSPVPLWFDSAIIFSAAVAGLVMALTAVYRVEKFLAQQFARWQVAMMVPAIFFLSSFGVYLGRYLRWNSWDIVANPAELLLSVAGRIAAPQDHLHTWGMTLVFTGVFSLLYYTLKKIPAMVLDIKKDGL
jgi:uncharacterized membrane protein